MKISKLWLLPIALLAIGLVIGYALPGYAAHTGGAVTLKDASGNAISAGSQVPYSPKQTCTGGTTGCHTPADYESSVVEILKDHVSSSSSGSTYTVRAPEHGVSAGYHFQQGRNIAWTSANSNAQRSFYGLPAFTSSPGMYGKY